MISLLYTIVGFIVALAILIIIHEFGHFWVARTLGVKVLRFSVGFGKPLWMRRFGKDQTELVVATIPLGGYVKMLDEMEGEVPEQERHRAFNRQSLATRSAIVVAGPLFNFIFAVFVYWALYMVGIDDIKPIVGKVPEASIAAAAGFREGDEIVSIDGQETHGWAQRRLYLFNRAIDRDSVTFVVKTATGKTATHVIDFSNVPLADVNAGFLAGKVGLVPYLPELEAVAGTVEDGPAKKAGMRSGDRIVRVGDKTINSWRDLVEAISTHPGEPLTVVVRRNGERHSMTIVPDSVDVDDKTIGRINIRPQVPTLPASLAVTLRYGPGQALVQAAAQTWTMSTLTLKMLYKMLQLEVSTKNISGPITIAQYAGHTAQIGLDRFLMFLAVVSISLGVINLLPIPILDGGHLLYNLIELIKGAPVSENGLRWGQQIGMAMLFALMVLAFYNDFTRLFQ